MTNPNANDDNRLNRIEQAIEADNHQIADNSRQIAENTAASNTLIQITTQQQRNFEMIFAEVQQVSTEIYEMQTENRSILEELQRRRNGDQN